MNFQLLRSEIKFQNMSLLPNFFNSQEVSSLLSNQLVSFHLLSSNFLNEEIFYLSLFE